MQLTADMQMIDSMGDGVMAKVTSPINPKLILNAIQASNNKDELEAALGELYDSDLSTIREQLEYAIFMADVMGYVAAELKIGD